MVRLPPILRSRLPRIALATAVLGAAPASCGESPFEPQGQGERIPLGRIIEDQVSLDSVRTYSFVASAGAEYGVSLEARGPVQLTVVDSSTQGVVQRIFADSSSPPLASNTAFFATPGGGVQLLEVRTFSAGAPTAFRFRAARRSLDPEARQAAFSVGDTIVGETMASASDIDVFLTQGTAGQEIVAVVEPSGPDRAGALSLVVMDPATGSTLGFFFAGAGPALSTTGRISFPASGRLAFRFSSLASAPFSGAYRFCTYAIDRAPERRAATVGLSTVVTGEAIDRSGDVDEFVFTVAAGAEINAFLQSPRPFRLEIAPRSGDPITVVTDTNVADTSLFRESTGRFRFLQAGTYVARVSGSELIADTGAYRFFLYPIDRRPERAPQSLTPGDTVAGEAIDLPGDVDEFTFSVAAGQEFNAFLQAQDGSPQTRLQLEAVDADGTVPRTAFSAGNDSSLLQQVSGRFAMRTTGTHRLRVMGADFAPFRGSSGAYRLFLYRVNRSPESRSATLTFGDSVLNESLDVPGDVDEFQVTVPDSSGANLVVELPSPPPGNSILVAQLVSAATGQVVAGTSVFAAGKGLSGRVLLGPGGYTLRVDATHFQDKPLLRGLYRVWLYKFRFGPELVGDTIAIGDTVSGEVLDPFGDEDVFHFYGVRHQRVNVAIQGQAAASASGGFRAFISGPRPGPDPIATVSTPTSSAALGDHQTLRIDLPVTGWYRIGISGGSSPEQVSEIGAYGFAVESVRTAPEAVSGTLVLGDSVTSEAIDVVGDVDEYSLTASAGQELAGTFGTAAPCCIYPSVIVYDPATGDTLAVNVGQNERLVGPFLVPASGQVMLAVLELPSVPFRQCFDAQCNGIFRYTGGYRLKVFAINRAPENVPASYALGDTVRNEAISPTGDIDEFTLSGTPGDTLSFWFRLRAAPVPAGSGISPVVINAATGAVLSGSGFSMTGSLPEFFSVGSFIVPATGSLLIRIRGSGSLGEGLGTAPYEFFIKRGT